MPSEQPHLPRDTHRALMLRGANRHLPIFGYEVAEMRDKPKPSRRLSAFARILNTLNL